MTQWPDDSMIQFVQQLSRLLQVRRITLFGKLVVDLR